MRSFKYVVAVLLVMSATNVFGQSVVSGRVWMPRWEGADQMYPFTTILTFATREGSRHQTQGARTFETEPAGWYRFSGEEGMYTLAFGGPGHFMRPIVLTNQYLPKGIHVPCSVAPTYDYAVFDRGGWDGDEVHAYYQTFVAKSTSITNVGFNLVHDGVDGEGPLGRHLLVSVHRKGDGTPDTWEQVGPTAPVLNVDAGGVKSRAWGAGWNSGEVAVEPGQTYAICIRPEEADGTFQCFWRKDAYGDGDCYRVADDGNGWAGRDMWMYVAGDGDGLVIPMQKCVKEKFFALTKFGKKWTQTFRAQGRSLASVMMYVAVANTQPMLPRHRFNVRVRRGGPDGPVVGVTKIARGQSTATGFGGVLGVTFMPGEVETVPGETYAIELSAFGTHEGFNPYRLHERDSYDYGTSYFKGKDMSYDLDMTIVEYAFAHDDWSMAVDKKNLLRNGDMESGLFDPDDFDAGGPEGWAKFSIDSGTAWWYQVEGDGDDANRYARVIGGSINGRTVDGGYVTAVTGLKKTESYRVSGRIRSSYAVDDTHQAFVGFDPTGQVNDPEAATIVWSLVGGAHDIWEEFVSMPVRPREDRVSIWLRGATTFVYNETYQADFDDFALRRVLTGPPSP